MPFIMPFMAAPLPPPPGRMDLGVAKTTVTGFARPSELRRLRNKRCEPGVEVEAVEVVLQCKTHLKRLKATLVLYSRAPHLGGRCH